MAEELTEEMAAEEIDTSIEESKTSAQSIDERLANVEALLKSQTQQEEEGEDEDYDGDDEPEEDDFDIDDVEPEDLAKSLVDDPERAFDFIERLTEACNLSPYDMIDDDGDFYITEDMQKALNESQERGQRFMAGILESLQEMRERTAKKDAVILQTVSQLAKSLRETAVELGELKKSLSSSTPKEPEEQLKLPEVGDGAANDPISNPVSVGQGSEIDYATARTALKKAFPGRYGDTGEVVKYNKYADLARKIPFDEVLASMPPEDKAMVQGCLP